METVENTHLPQMPWPDERLPGVTPIAPAEWLVTSEVFAGQMALRDRLLATRRDEVAAALPGSEAAIDELMETVLADLAGREGYEVAAGAVTRPDGVTVALDRDDPLGVLGRLVQEDLCIMQRLQPGAFPVLSAAVLCFPSNWTLSEKLGHGLERIHVPVPAYDENIARRVARLIDGVQAGRPLMRMNRAETDSPDLWRAKREAEPHPPRKGGGWVRMERQVLLRLPRSGAVVFSIHTFVAPRAAEDGAGGA